MTRLSPGLIRAAELARAWAGFARVARPVSELVARALESLAEVLEREAGEETTGPGVTEPCPVCGRSSSA